MRVSLITGGRTTGVLLSDVLYRGEAMTRGKLAMTTLYGADGDPEAVELTLPLLHHAPNRPPPSEGAVVVVISYEEMDELIDEYRALNRNTSNTE